MIQLIGVEQHGVVDCGDAGNVVWFMDGRQQGTCRVWEGRSQQGDIVRVITDLGALDYDLTADPLPPWIAD